MGEILRKVKKHSGKWKNEVRKWESCKLSVRNLSELLTWEDEIDLQSILDSYSVE